MNRREPQISASILNADFAALGSEVVRAVDGGVDSIHLDVMDGHFVDNLSLGPVVVDALRPHAALPFHTHLMISQPLHFVDSFANAGSDLIIFHIEADDDPEAVIEAIHRTGRGAGLALVQRHADPDPTARDRRDLDHRVSRGPLDAGRRRDAGADRSGG